MADNEQAVAVREQGEIVRSESLSLKQVTDRVNLVHEVLKKVMKINTHYGTVPGCGAKMVLLKPGADVLAMTFRLVPQFKVERTDLEGGHREFDVTCSMFTPGGELLGQGVGSASTMEKKYRYRKDRDGSRIENEDIADVYNTVLKIAKKRAHIDATLTVTGAADLFTQDLIDEDEPQRPPVKMPVETPTTPAPKAGTPPAVNPAGQTITGVVSKLAEKPTKTGGKKYGVCIATNEGEQWANTFDATLHDAAKELRGKMVTAFVTQGPYGLDLDGIKEVKEEQGTAAE